MAAFVNLISSIYSYELLSKVILGAFVAFFVHYLFNRKKEKNPFETDCRRNAEPPITDKLTRKNIIKRKFTPSAIPESLDAIVIGSGIGGLSSAALLAKSGKKVLVLEQLNKAGGCTHTFKEKGREFDVGIHYIGEVLKQTITKTYLDQITNGQLQWSPLEDAFDVVCIGGPGNLRRYEIGSGQKQIDTLKKYFPDDTDAIDEFYAVVKTVNKDMVYHFGLVRSFPRFLCRIMIKLGFFKLLKWHRLSQLSLKEFLENITNNQELRDVLSYCFGDYGTMPSEVSIGMHALLWRHFFHGVAYPVGGSSEIAMQIIPVITNSGGQVLTNATVEQIICRNGRAVGVRVKSTKGDVNIYAPVIITDAGIHNTFKKLLPPEVAKKSSITQIVNGIDHAIAGLSVFVGLDGSNEELGLKAQNIWAFSENDIEKISREYFDSSPESVTDRNIPLLFQSFPSAKDPSWDKRFPGKSTMAIVTFAKYEWFEKWEDEPVKKRSHEYSEIKDLIGQKMVDQCLEIFPHLKDKIDDVCVGSPITNNHYIASPRGEIYGLDHNRRRFASDSVSELRPETDIPGLYLTGQDTFICGFSGALFGGLQCASAVLKRDILPDLIMLHDQLK